MTLHTILKVHAECTLSWPAIAAACPGHCTDLHTVSNEGLECNCWKEPCSDIFHPGCVSEVPLNCILVCGLVQQCSHFSLDRSVTVLWVGQTSYNAMKQCRDTATHNVLVVLNFTPPGFGITASYGDLMAFQRLPHHIITHHHTSMSHEKSP